VKAYLKCGFTSKWFSVSAWNWIAVKKSSVQNMKPNPGRLLIWGLIILVCSAFEAEAAVVTLAWDLSPSPNIAGYRLYSGTTSGVYSQTSEVGNATSTLVSNLVTGKTYFFVVTAYNTMGVESAPSNEVSYLAPPTTGSAQLVSPAPGSTFTSSSVTFNSESNESIQDLSSERWPKIDIDYSLRLLALPPRSLRER
jgi:Fibronectin type III domain